MIVFLTSSPSGALDVPNDAHLLDESNHFVDNLKKYWKKDMKALMISAYPDSYMANDEMTSFFYDCFTNSGVPVVSFDLLDNRNLDVVVNDYDVIMLAGGHVPTQNDFFKRIHLKERLALFEGIVIGVSAGTMNSAKRVYAQPELPTESYDPNYVKYMEGLGLTELNILPHYQMVKDSLLDGKRLYKDITYADSYGEHFLVLVDGSYVLETKESRVVYGEAYTLSDGKMYLLCNENESVVL